jgi:carboxyl-terminal processing protease
MKRKKTLTLGLIIGTAIVTAFLVVGLGLLYLKETDRMIVDSKMLDELEKRDSEYKKMDYISDLVEERFYFDHDDNKIVDSACKSMVESLDDPYSEYFGTEEKDYLAESLEGSFKGIGLVFERINGEFVVTEVMTESPADIAGIKKGDKILSVDGKSFDKKDDLIKAIRGKAGEGLELQYQRDNKTFKAKMVRANIEEATVEKRLLENSIGYIKITSFSSSTYKNFDKALATFEKAKLKGLILDLRGNPGGLFDEGIKVADRLLPECRISYTEDVKGKRKDYNSDERSTDLQIVVLVDGRTASTAEMVAAALQGNKKAILMGEKTFGKGVMQEIHEFDDGSAVHLTVGEFFAPGGATINKKGVQPDIEVKKSDPKEDQVLKQAVKELQG